jgi:hypothetical protein
LGSPATAVGFSFLTGGIDQLFKLYLTAATAAATPLPSDVAAELNQLVQLQAVPFTANDISNVKYLPSDHPLGQRLFPGGARNAITFQNLIIVRPSDYLFTPTSASARCSRLKEWAHELTHVHQYNQYGMDVFISRFIEQSREGYPNMPLESEAFVIENKIGAECQTSSYTTMAAFNAVIALKGKAVSDLISELAGAAKSKEVSLTPDGGLRTVSPAAMARLTEKYGSDVLSALMQETNAEALPDLIINGVNVEPLGRNAVVRVSNRLRLVGMERVSGLKPGQSTTVRFSASTMKGATEKNQIPERLLAIVDVSDSVSESDESNNHMTRVITRTRH